MLLLNTLYRHRYFSRHASHLLHMQSPIHYMDIVFSYLGCNRFGHQLSAIQHESLISLSDIHLVRYIVSHFVMRILHYVIYDFPLFRLPNSYLCGTLTRVKNITPPPSSSIINSFQNRNQTTSANSQRTQTAITAALIVKVERSTHSRPFIPDNKSKYHILDSR